jgi:hydrogenase small subunit
MLAARGITRRQFLKMCGVVAVALAIPAGELGRFADAVAAAARPRVVWLEFQDCTGDSESFLRAAQQADPLQSGVTDPSLTSLLLDVLSVEYHETLMVPSGAYATKSRDDVVRNYAGQYICVVEGSIPTAANGVYCTVGGESALNILKQVASKAQATLAVGTCAAYGGLPGAQPNPTGAAGVKDAVPGLQNLVNLPGCPHNVVNLVATIVYFVAKNQLPSRDASGRPQFAYGTLIHARCERRRYHDDEKLVLAWGDQGHRQGWCLRAMGCHGPTTYSNCPVVKWNQGTGWPVQAGHGCLGCTSANFWDASSSLYNVVFHGNKTQNDCAVCHGSGGASSTSVPPTPKP